MVNSTIDGYSMVSSGLAQLGVAEVDRDSVLRLLQEHGRRADAERSHRAAVTSLESQVSAETARVVQATVNRIAEIDHEFGMLSSQQVAEALGSRSKSPRGFTSDLRERGRLLYIRRLNTLLYPGFQFEIESPRIRAVIAPLIALAQRHDRSIENVSLWLCRPTTYLDGDRPVDHIDETERVLDVAEQAWGVEW